MVRVKRGIRGNDVVDIYIGKGSLGSLHSQAFKFFIINAVWDSQYYKIFGVYDSKTAVTFKFNAMK